MTASLFGRLGRGAIALSLLVSPTLAAAAAGTPTVSPFVAMSYLASDSSRAALCGVAGANAAATTATTTAAAATTTASGQPAPVQGCILPVVDPAAAPVATTLGRSFSLIGPLAAALAGLVAILVIANAANDEDTPPVDNPPISPG